MTLTEAVMAWSEAVADAYMYDLSGLESAADEARQRALAVRPILLVLLAQAEAAIAVAEYQATSGYDPSVDGKTYAAERGRLWHAFITARARAKGANNGSV